MTEYNRVNNSRNSGYYNVKTFNESAG